VAKVLLIIAPENFRDEELLHTKEELERAGVQTAVASKKTGEAKGKLGARVNVSLGLDDVRVDDYDGVVFVGGSGSAIYFHDEKAHSIARETFSKGKVISAICIAPITLANAGVLSGKRATVWNGEYIEKLKAKGAIYTGNSVEIDGNVITANGPHAARDFGRAIASAIKG